MPDPLSSASNELTLPQVASAMPAGEGVLSESLQAMAVHALEERVTGDAVATEVAAAPVEAKPEPVIAIENLLPATLNIVAPASGQRLVLSPLERRAVTENELAAFDIARAEGLQWVRRIRQNANRVDKVLEQAVGLSVFLAIAYVFIGIWLPESLSFELELAYWVSVPLVTLLVFWGLLKWASGQGAESLAKARHQAALALAAGVGFGAPVLAVYVNEDFPGLTTGEGLKGEEWLGLASQTVFIALVSLVPALFFYIFDRERIGTVRGSFFRNVFALDPDMHNLRDAEAKYGARAEEFFGRPDETRTGRVVRGQHLSITVATVLIALGWVFTLSSPPIPNAGDARTLTSFFEPRPHALAFAFLGAYFFTLTTLARRYSQGDLTAKAYGQVAARFILAAILCWVLMAAGIADGDAKALLVTAFLVGVFPESGMLFIRESVPGAFRRKLPPLEEKLPLTDLEGIDFYDRVRLAEEGVNNIQAFVRHDMVSLMLRTRIPVSRLADWADQAILFLHTEDTDDETVTSDRKKLRAFGIRTATDFVDAVEAARADGTTAVALVSEGTGIKSERLELMARTMCAEPMYRTVSHWRISAHTPSPVVEFPPRSLARDGSGENRYASYTS